MEVVIGKGKRGENIGFGMGENVLTPSRGTRTYLGKHVDADCVRDKEILRDCGVGLLHQMEHPIALYYIWHRSATTTYRKMLIRLDKYY